MTAAPLPPSRCYQNHHLDSTRWRVFEPRDDDIVVTTSYKSGTTWMQQILHLLVFKSDPEAPTVSEASPWLDARFHEPVEEVGARLAAQTHRRFIKSHLPMDGLPCHPQVKYVVVARDARDVFMSLWNHYRNYTEDILTRLNDTSDWSGDLLPRAPDDLHQCWRDWMTRGYFDWESEGWPFWSNLHHTRTWWENRHLENLLLVHYGDLLTDPRSQVQRLADFLEIGVSTADVDATVKGASFDAMKASYKKLDEDPWERAFKGGTDAFIYKGTNGRWRGVLTEQDLALYEAAKRRVLEPDCAEWLEQGWLGSGA